MLLNLRSATSGHSRPARSLSALCAPLAPQDQVFSAIGPRHERDDQCSPEHWPQVRIPLGAPILNRPDMVWAA